MPSPTAMNRLFSDADFGNLTHASDWVPPVSVEERNDEILLTAELVSGCPDDRGAGGDQPGEQRDADFGNLTHASDWVPPVSVEERNDEILLTAELAGIRWRSAWRTTS